MNNPLLTLLIGLTLLNSSFADEADQASRSRHKRNEIASDSFLNNGVTAHRGDSGEHPENTLAAFRSAIDLGADWLELDILRTSDGQLVVIHDPTTGRVGDRVLDVALSNYDALSRIDVATDFRRRTGRPLKDCPPHAAPLLKDVLSLVMQQNRTRVSIQPKMDCVADAIALVRSVGAERWVGFNDGNLAYMSEVKRRVPEIPVFWDRGAETDVDEDIRIAKRHGFESLVLHHSGITDEKVRKIKAAGLEVGAWTVNDKARMTELLEIGVERLYTDHPKRLLELKSPQPFRRVSCEGTYQNHLQGVCVDADMIYWSFTTALVKTDRHGNLLKQIPVANHHGDLCYREGKLFVAVNLGKFNDPNGNADSWVYVYDAETLEEFARHPTQEVFHGAGGIGFQGDHFFVVGGLPDGFDENYVYEYDGDFEFQRRHLIKSGHTLLGIQTATYAHNRWWFGCYGAPRTLLVTDDKFRLKGRYELDCSLGIEGLPAGRLLVASGRCDPENGCSGSVQVAIPDEQRGFRIPKASSDTE